MLARMGWSEGKGLGAQEDGTTDYVKVQKRLDNRGLSIFLDDNLYFTL